ncbi:GNAT family N-acetyltransferase [Ornithinimicrobium sp. LYQ92]|uniref:GNAT family N-acetyltransferase n=1 Tax=Serinicoccus sp. LYQ92 TaxID=3378798 RepID=UPI003853074A
MAKEGATVGGPVLEGDGVRLVPPGSGHTDLLLALGHDEQCRRWGDAVPVRDATSARSWVRVAQERWDDPGPWTPWQWVAELADDDTAGAGSGWRPGAVVELRPDGHGAAEVGYAVHPDLRGRALAARSLDLALGYAFGTGLRVARWRAEAGNWASARVAWQLGFSAPQQVRGLLAGGGQDGGDCGPRDGWVASLAHDEPRRPAHRWLEVPELRGAGVLLRAWRDDDDDVDRVVQACTDPRSLQYLPDLPTPYGPAQAHGYLAGLRLAAAQGSGIGWCVADAATGRACGSLDLRGLDPSLTAGELGCWTHPEARGRGLMTRAVRLALGYALGPAPDGLGLRRVGWRAAASNTASRRVATAAGLREVGRDRDGERLRDGTVEDFVRYDVLAAEMGPPARG